MRARSALGLGGCRACTAGKRVDESQIGLMVSNRCRPCELETSEALQVLYRSFGDLELKDCWGIGDWEGGIFSCVRGCVYKHTSSHTHDKTRNNNLFITRRIAPCVNGTRNTLQPPRQPCSIETETS
uniref:SFRICE_026636 n=1 Tax=Spodoptera frugiperda TaxID=7108 RepID=A0A2H1WG53_SPOFR